MHVATLIFSCCCCFLSLPANYPCVPPVLEIEASESGNFSYRDADDLYQLLMEESLKRIGGTMVFDLITFAQEYMAGGCDRGRGQR